MITKNPELLKQKYLIDLSKESKELLELKEMILLDQELDEYHDAVLRSVEQTAGDKISVQIEQRLNAEATLNEHEWEKKLYSFEGKKLEDMSEVEIVGYLNLVVQGVMPSMFVKIFEQSYDNEHFDIQKFTNKINTLTTDDVWAHFDEFESYIESHGQKIPLDGAKIREYLKENKDFEIQILEPAKTVFLDIAKQIKTEDDAKKQVGWWASIADNFGWNQAAGGIALAGAAGTGYYAWQKGAETEAGWQGWLNSVPFIGQGFGMLAYPKETVMRLALYAIAGTVGIWGVKKLLSSSKESDNESNTEASGKEQESWWKWIGKRILTIGGVSLAGYALYCHVNKRALFPLNEWFDLKTNTTFK